MHEGESLPEQYRESWDRIRQIERPFWSRVWPCIHGPDCEACCWPYVLPRSERRGESKQPGQERYNNKSIARACTEYYHGIKLGPGQTARRFCPMTHCANPHHVKVV